MAKRYKVVREFLPFKVNTILELTGDQKAYTDGYGYINRSDVEKKPDTFEPVEEEKPKPLTADTFFGNN